MKYSVAEIYELSQTDGIGTSLNDIKVRQITDPDLADMWEEAQEMMARIEQYLEDNHTNPFDGEEEDDE